ncbi:hypothetical protein GGH92_008284 [Coemansia sp. RSA 2673]|nr:hypothetical protein GGH92_008284 [Coemansia sp. RSA 2673]
MSTAVVPGGKHESRTTFVGVGLMSVASARGRSLDCVARLILRRFSTGSTTSGGLLEGVTLVKPRRDTPEGKWHATPSSRPCAQWRSAASGRSCQAAFDALPSNICRMYSSRYFE